MPETSVIITNWNGKQWLSTCLDALNRQTYRDFELIFVDDGSTDGSAAWVAENYPQARLIKQRPHVGFAAANNIGIRAARGEYIVTLNNDTRPDENFLRELVAGLTAPDVGMVAAQMRLWDSPETLDSAGIAVDWAGFGWNCGWGQAVSAWNEPGEVFGPCAGAALYRRAMLDEIGLFDEDFYAYYEDVDLAWRARRAGRRCRYAPAAWVLHKHSATGRLFSQKKVFLLNRNRLWAIVKNYAPVDLLWAWPLIILGDWFSALKQLWQTRSLVPLRARWAALRGARGMWRKRRPGRRVRLAARPEQVGP